MTYENLQAKTDVLMSVYENIHKHIRKNEALENKVSFSVGALFMLFAAFLLKEQIPLDNFWKLVLGTMIISMAMSALYFLYEIHERIKTQCKMIVNIEKTFGLYESYWFTNHLSEQDRKCIPTQVFENNLSNWGEKRRRLLVLPHALGIIFSAAAAITSLFVELPPSKQDGASQKSIVTPSNSQAEKYLDIKPRPIGQ